ncbi:MAG: DUF4129 domain-containing protein [Anaerolineae bacterium]|nr:DUF4129 domain-containing protein [Anaerolineae bacterium]
MTVREAAWRRWLLLLTILAMDATWLAPWAMLLTGVREGLSPGGFYALLVVALLTTHVLWASRLALGLQQAVAGLLATLCGLFLTGTCLYRGYPLLGSAWVAAWLRDLAALRGGGAGGLALGGVALYAWARAISLVQRVPAAESVGYQFRVGIVAWFWFHLIGLLVGANAPLAWLSLFFALGLFAIGLARVEEVQRERGAVRSPFTPSWALLLAAGALGAVAVGLLVTRVLSRTLIAAVWHALSPVGVVLRWVLYQLVWLVFVVVEPLVNALYRALAPGGQDPVGIVTPPAPTTPLRAPAPTGLPVPVRAILWAGFALTLLVIIALVVIGLQRREAEGEAEAGPEAAWEQTDGEDADLRAGLRRLRRLARRLAGLRPGPYTLATVREIYASLLRMASRHGMPRGSAETPYEFESRLDGAWPEVRGQVEALTEAYVRVRYGGRRLSGEELEALRMAWKELQERVEQRDTEA